MAKGRGIIAFSLILLFLIASSAVCLQPVRAQSLTNISINADGNITPSSAPIIRSGNTYTLTSNIAGSVEIDRSSIVFNGNGHTINGEESILFTGGEEFGIDLESVQNVTVTNTTVTNTGIGVLALDTATAAINVEGGGSNIITGNNASNNYNAIRLLESNNNLIVANNITNNHNPYSANPALMFWSSSNNTVYHNNFINNTSSAGDANDEGAPVSGNTWDDGFPAGGNYWGNQTGREIDSTGISDTPYIIDSQNKDLYPLIQPFSSSFLVNYEQEVAPPKVSIESPLNKTYSKTSISLTFQISKTFNWIGYSLDGQSNVTTDGNATISSIAYGSHCLTVYANSTFGIIGVSKAIDFTVTKSESCTFMIVVSVAIIATVIGLAIAVLFARRQRKTAYLKQRPFPMVRQFHPPSSMRDSDDKNLKLNWLNYD